MNEGSGKVRLTALAIRTAGLTSALLILAFARAYGDGSDAVERLLSPGAEAEATIAAGEVHRYRIATDAAAAGGGWLRIAVEERGADVILDLRAPDGSLLATADSPNSRFGLESLWLKAGEGERWVEVRVSPQVQVAGAYAIAAETMPDASPEPSRQAAERLAAEASRRYAEDTREGREAALAAYRQALPLWRALARAREEWDTLYSLAVLLRMAGTPRQALEMLTEALDVERSLADPRQEARTLNEMGFARFSLGEVEAARALYQKSLDAWERAPDPYGQALTLNNLGLTHHSQGDLRAAIPFYERARALLLEAGDPRGEAVLVNNLGGVLRDLGEPVEARARFEEALASQRKLGDHREEANVLGNLAQVDKETGRYGQALELYQQALAMVRREGDARAEGRLLSSLGVFYGFLGDPGRAAENLEAALALRRRTGDRAGEAITLHNLALAVEDSGDAARAADLFGQALAIQRALGDRRAEAITLYTLGSLEAESGQRETGSKRIERSLEILRALEDRREICEALRRAGEVRAAAGQAEEARSRLAEALALCRAVADTPRELKALVALARAERASGHPEAAAARAEEALARIESTRTSLASPERRASYLSRQLGAYELAIALQMEAHRRAPAAGHDRAALALSERARARSLLDLLEESGAEVERGVDPALAERRRLLAVRLEAKARRRLALGASARDAAQRRSLEGELRALADELDTVDAEIRQRSPRYADLVRPRPLDAAAIQSLLDPGTLMLVYSLGEERSFLWAVSRSSLHSFELPPRRTIEAAARRVYEAWRVLDLRARREDEAAAAKLAQLVLAPAARLLAGQPLVVVAEGALQYVPFGALPLPASPGKTAEPLLIRHEMVSLPSASALAAQRQLLTGRAAVPRRVAVLADPVFRPDDPRLFLSGSPAPRRTVPVSAAATGAMAVTAAVPARGQGFDRLAWSRAEAETIARLAGKGRAFVATDFDASLETLTSGKLRGYGVIHLATHGVVDAEHPALSGLVLSLVDRNGRERPGFLALPAVYSLDLGADLVVLSGCETALGREVRGEGLVGLARGFLYAGAARVMASLWRVEDHATAELMRRFYEALLRRGEPPAAALREAQRSMIRERRWSDPFYWAGFALYGDWR